LRALRIVCVVGTRPEGTKVAPVVIEARRRPGFSCALLSTGQHTDLLDHGLEAFGLRPDAVLDVSWENGSLGGFAGSALDRITAYFERTRPDMVVVQGDTASTFVGAMAAFWLGLPVAHLEAGLRSGRLAAPFPEEGHRRLAAVISNLHLAPTVRAARNLLQEGADPNRVLVTGNTSIDAAHYMKARAAITNRLLADFVAAPGHIVLVTAHRRESWPEDLGHIADAVRTVVELRDDVRVVFPVHPNPIVREVVKPRLADHPRVFLCEPLPYAQLLAVLRRSRIVVTDSGGIQEEAPEFDVPVLVTRAVTERPEGLETGAAVLVGTSPEIIVENVLDLLNDRDKWVRMAGAPNPYGDGRAAERSLDAIEWFFGMRKRPREFRYIGSPQHATS
jgi:UDP-N-acetylglucosamine 2-epimerase (non-hydrolysing)